MRRVLMLAGAMAALMAGSIGPLAAQGPQEDPSFSNEVLATYGLPDRWSTRFSVLVFAAGGHRSGGRAPVPDVHLLVRTSF